MSKYTIKKTGSTSTMNVVSCSWKKGCMTNTQAVITPSASKDYKSANGWFQAKGLHDKYKGTALIIYYKNVGKGKLSLVWYRPSTGLKIKGVGTFEEKSDEEEEEFDEEDEEEEDEVEEEFDEEDEEEDDEAEDEDEDEDEIEE